MCLHSCSVYDGVVNHVYAALTRVVVASPLPEAAWYSAAEAALTALYALHPSPEHLSAAVLKRLARTAFASQAGGAEEEEQDTAAGGKGAAEGAEAGAAAEEPAAEAMDADNAEGAAAEGGEAKEQAAGDKAEGEGAAAPAASQQTGSQAARSMHSVVALSRFFFVLGHVALQHLVSRWALLQWAAALLVPPLLVFAVLCCKDDVCRYFGWQQHFVGTMLVPIFLLCMPASPHSVAAHCPPPCLSPGVHRACREGCPPHAPGAREEGG